MTTTQAELFDFDALPMDQLLADMKSVVAYAMSHSPRSLQVELGPSEIGHPCPRRIAMGLMGEPAVAAAFDPLPSAVGTGAHHQFGKAFEMDNQRLGYQRWLVEHRVSPWPGMGGNLDLFDTVTRTVVDHKFLAADKVKSARTKGPREVYRNQGQVYAAGLVADGHRVDRVALWLLPRGGLIAHSYLWHTPFDPAVAKRVEQRTVTITGLCADLEVDRHPERYNLIPHDDSDCAFCPWHSKHPVAGAHCNPAA